MGPLGMPTTDVDGRQQAPSNLEVLDALGELLGQLRSYLQERLRGTGLNPPEAKALRRIDGALSMKELGQQMHCDASFITAVADALEERGLVKRMVASEDRRLKNLVLTAKGKAMRSKLVTETFAQLPGVRALDESERTTFYRLLRKMIAAESDCEAARGRRPL